MPKIVKLTTTAKTEIIEYPSVTGELNNNLKFLQEGVGGYIEFIDLPKHKAVMVVNEEGKMYDLPTNVFATALFYQNYANLRDFIVGDVLLLSSEVNSVGDPVGLSDAQAEQIVTDLNWLIDEAKSEQIDQNETNREYYAESQGE